MPMTPTLAELLKGSRPDYEGEPTYRMSMLPFGTYPNSDGSESLGLALPGMLKEPLDAVSRLFGTPSNPGTFTQGPDAPGNKEDMTTLLLSMYGGNAMNPAAVIPKGGLASGIMREAAESAPLRGYHGTAAQFDGGFRPSANGDLGPGFYAAYDTPQGSGAAHAGMYPIEHGNGSTYPGGSRIYPLDIKGNFASYDDLAAAHAASGGDVGKATQALRDQGYDGVKAFGQINTWTPGTVTSPLTGETLFSDTGKPSIPGAAIAGAEGNTPLRGYRGGIKPEHVLPPEDHRTFWGSSAPEVANTYAGLRPNGDIDKIVAPRIEEVGGRQAVAPADFNFSNPMTVDAGGAQWDRIPFENKTWATSDQLAQIARDRGHDGLILNNILDSAFAFGDHTPGNTYAALKRGTVTSPLTGETLFSDTGKPSLMGSAVAGAEANQNSPTLAQLLLQRAGSQ